MSAEELLRTNEEKAKALCLQKLQQAFDTGDTEGGHCDADEALCDFLKALGHNDVVELYERLPKWYS